MKKINHTSGKHQLLLLKTNTSCIFYWTCLKYHAKPDLTQLRKTSINLVCLYRRLNLQAKAYMPFEAFWALPEKSPPIVCEEKRPQVRYGTNKSAYLILVPKQTRKFPQINPSGCKITGTQCSFPISSERRSSLHKAGHL